VRGAEGGSVSPTVLVIGVVVVLVVAGMMFLRRRKR